MLNTPFAHAFNSHTKPFFTHTLSLSKCSLILPTFHESYVALFILCAINTILNTLNLFPFELNLSFALCMDVPQAGDGTSETTRRRAPGRRRSTTTTQVEDGGAAPPTNAPCGACKFLRRKCISGCIFAPHFGSDQGAARFAAVHKVFGASNVSKLLMHIPVNRRHDAVVTISYEAQARLSDPVYGCVSTIIALQQQV